MFGRIVPALFLALSLVLSLSLPACKDTAKMSGIQRTVVIDVQGMTCNSCVEGITDALKQIEGVQKVEVSLEKKSATVAFDSGKVAPEALVKAIVKLGYRASLRK